MEILHLSQPLMRRSWSSRVFPKFFIVIFYDHTLHLADTLIIPFYLSVSQHTPPTSSVESSTIRLFPFSSNPSSVARRQFRVEKSGIVEAFHFAVHKTTQAILFKRFSLPKVVFSVSPSRFRVQISSFAET